MVIQTLVFYFYYIYLVVLLCQATGKGFVGQCLLHAWSKAWHLIVSH